MAGARHGMCELTARRGRGTVWAFTVAPSAGKELAIILGVLQANCLQSGRIVNPLAPEFSFKF
jgi:hypothetical protein